MFRSFFLDRKWALWSWGGFLLLLSSLYIQVQLTVWLNSWYKEFYDLLQQANTLGVAGLDKFWEMMFEFATIAFPYIFVAVFTSFFARHYAFRWRQAMTMHYLPNWLDTQNNIEGSSQRIQEDCSRFARQVESLGLGVFRSLLTLIAFIPILHTLSSKVEVEFLKDIPSSLVWIAILMSIGGMVVSWFVGIKLPGLEYNNQKVEASFRKALVYTEDDRQHTPHHDFVELFTGIRLNYFRLYWHYTYFNAWENIYGQFAIILPYLVMGPSLFTGVVTLGFLTQTGNAFGKVINSFSYLIDRWTDITELRSIHKRLHEFEQTLAITA